MPASDKFLSQEEINEQQYEINRNQAELNREQAKINRQQTQLNRLIQQKMKWQAQVHDQQYSTSESESEYTEEFIDGCAIRTFPSSPQREVLDVEEIQEDTEDEKSMNFVVEAVVNERGSGRNKQYLVKWYGYPPSENTWEPADHVSHLPLLIEAFKARKSRTTDPSSKRKPKEPRTTKESTTIKKQRLMIQNPPCPPSHTKDQSAAEYRLTSGYAEADTVECVWNEYFGLGEFTSRYFSGGVKALQALPMKDRAWRLAYADGSESRRCSRKLSQMKYIANFIETNAERVYGPGRPSTKDCEDIRRQISAVFESPVRLERIYTVLREESVELSHRKNQKHFTSVQPAKGKP